ncbi:MAG: TonB family protein [Bacteroidetes bacterium]|nr:TonB family protein [Bacteroidota bacterium]
MKNLLKQEMMYPSESLKNNIGGVVTINYVINEVGEIKSYSIKKSINKELDAEAIRLFRLLEWTPAIDGNTPIATSDNIDIEFDVKKFKKYVRQRGYNTISYQENILPDTSLKIYNKVHQMPYPLVKETTLSDFFAKYIDYPSRARIENIQGDVIISFIVEKSGYISNVQTIKSLGYGCDEEAIRIAKLIRWSCGINYNKAVRVRMQLPITFKLSNDFKDNSYGEQR